jgi:hypothetical protein
MNDNLPQIYNEVARDLAIRAGVEQGTAMYSDSMLFQKEREILLLEAA